MIQPLTHKERTVLEFIEDFFNREGTAPSYQEIKEHFGFASFNSVQRYLQQLTKKKYLYIPGGNQKRAISILQPSSSLQTHLKNLRNESLRPFVGSLKKETSISTPSHTPALVSESLSLPFLGRVAAGLPIEALDHNESIDVPSSLVNNKTNTFALRVLGLSMIDEGILDGDVILVEKSNLANNGELIVATVENEATVKRVYYHNTTEGPSIELRPANPNMKSFWYSPEKVHIRGKVISLIRKF